MEYCELNKYMFDLFLQHREQLAAILQAHPEYRTQLSGWLMDVTELTP